MWFCFQIEWLGCWNHVVGFKFISTMLKWIYNEICIDLPKWIVNLELLTKFINKFFKLLNIILHPFFNESKSKFLYMIFNIIT
jgi:hypothetical protein